MPNDHLTLEFTETLNVLFSPDDNQLGDLEAKGIFVRDNATVEILDDDSKNNNFCDLYNR